MVNKLLNNTYQPEESYLVLELAAAEKFSGYPKETQFSLQAKPWFKFETIWKFNKSDFTPEPSVDTVLLKITKRQNALIDGEDKNSYKAFIQFAFSTWKKDLKVGLKNTFTYSQWKRLARDNGFSTHSKPTDLTFG